MKKLTLDLRALASEPRLKIVLFLRKNRRTVSEIAEYLGVSAPTVIFHLAKLLREGYVQREREGKHMYYSLLPIMKNSHTFLKKLRKQFEN